MFPGTGGFRVANDGYGGYLADDDGSLIISTEKDFFINYDFCKVFGLMTYGNS